MKVGIPEGLHEDYCPQIKGFFVVVVLVVCFLPFNSILRLMIFLITKEITITSFSKNLLTL